MSDDLEKTGHLEEPSVLDYVKSLFRFGNGERIRIPGEENILIKEPSPERRAFITEAPVLQPVDDVRQDLSFVEAPSTEAQPAPPPFPWRSLLAFLLAWIG